jgi:WS/DGAT C-terminal domain
VMSYAGGLYFGFTACPDKVPRVQRLAVYTGEALDELEAVFLGSKRKGVARKPTRQAVRKASVRKTARRKAKAQR